MCTSFLHSDEAIHSYFRGSVWVDEWNGSCSSQTLIMRYCDCLPSSYRRDPVWDGNTEMERVIIYSFHLFSWFLWAKPPVAPPKPTLFWELCCIAITCQLYSARCKARKPTCQLHNGQFRPGGKAKRKRIRKICGMRWIVSSLPLWAMLTVVKQPKLCYLATCWCSNTCISVSSTTISSPSPSHPIRKHGPQVVWLIISAYHVAIN